MKGGTSSGLEVSMLITYTNEGGISWHADGKELYQREE